MKWVKVAIGAVIAILSIGIITTSVYNMTQEKIGERTDIITGNIRDVQDVSPNIDHLIYNSADFYNVFSNDTTIVDKIENGTIFLEYIGVNGSFTVKITSFKLESDTYSGGFVSIISIIYNDVEYTDYIKFISVFSGNRGGYTNFFGDTSTEGTGFSEVFGFEFVVGDTLTLYEQDETIPPQLTGINATLILLAPLVFAGGVLAYLLNKQNY